MPMHQHPTTRAGHPSAAGPSAEHPAEKPPARTGGTAGDISTVTRLAEFAQTLRSGNRTVEEILDDVLASALELIADADTGCITTLRRGSRTVVASTDPVAEQMCRLQYELGEGPIDTELWHLDTVVSTDLECESRWPHFAAAAVDAGVRSLAAFRLYTGDADLGALVFYSSNTDAFGPDDVVVGEAVAAHSAIALLSARERSQFAAGLASRDVIGQAKGILMERYSIDALRAFDLLTMLSQERNVPLRSVAVMIADPDQPAASAIEVSARYGGQDNPVG